MSKTTARDHSRRTLGPPTWPFPIPGAVLGVQNLNKTKLQNNTRKSRDMDCRSSKKSAAMDFPQFLGLRFSKTVLVERCRKKSHETAEQDFNLLGLGAEDGKAQKTVCGKRAKCITHKGSNAFPEKATTAEHH